MDVILIFDLGSWYNLDSYDSLLGEFNLDDLLELKIILDGLFNVFNSDDSLDLTLFLDYSISIAFLFWD